MKMRLAALAMVFAFLGAFVAAPMATAAAPKTQAGPTVPVTGTLPGGTFVGEISDLAFVNQAGQLVLSGVLNGTATVGGVAREIVDQAFSVVVTPAVNRACTILTLDLGPIFLDLLGLQVDLSAISLDITAVPGPGNLLGNLLCAVANLLNGGSPAAGLANLLNRILGLLG